MAQTKDNNATLPFREIPEAPTSFTTGNTMGRLIDGLGFRYYWASEGLRENDLSFKPSEEARTSFETLQHIKGLTDVIINSLTNTPNIRPAPEENLSYEELRAKTLQNLWEASEILKKSSEEDFENFNLVFQNDNGSRSFPFWNQINGPISDALWHVGQVVTFRRTSGNPLNSNISVFNGIVRQ